MKSIFSIATGLISSLIFIFFVGFWFGYFDIILTLIMWTFALPVFLIGGSITLIILFYLEKSYKSISYFTSLSVFVFFGIICSIFALWYFTGNAWNGSVLEYLSLGILGSTLYFHIWLLLNKVATFIKTKLSTHTKPTLWIVGGSFLIVLVMILYILDRNHVSGNIELEAAIYSIVEDKNSSAFNLESLTDFTWDQAALFGPYTTREMIEENLGIRYYGPTGGIEWSEEKFLLIFLHHDQVIQYVILDRQDGIDFIAEKAFITPSTGLIKIKKTY